ncbi:MAG: tetratricopeptide repeat protein [Prochlorococcaceae cyanobacterium]
MASTLLPAQALAISPAIKAGQERLPILMVQAQATTKVQIPAEVREWLKQANDLKAKGDYKAASDLQEKILAWAEISLGSDHPVVATVLNNLAGLHQAKGAHTKAELFYLRSLTIREKGLGPDHPDTATVLNNLAVLYLEQGAYAKAEPLLLRSLTTREKALGPDHPDTALSLNNLAELYRSQGAYAKAESLNLRALTIREKLLGPDHPDTVRSLNNLAVLYQSQGAYAKAEPHSLRALKIWEKVLGPDHPDTALSLNNLAELYRAEGAYPKAEPLYLRSLKIREKVLGPDHPDTALSLNNLAELYRAEGAYPKAEPLYLRSLNIRERVLGPDHPDTALSLNNLAALHQAQGAYAKAEPLYLRALRILEKVLGRDHPDTASSLSNLGVLYQTQGNYAKAEPLYLRALRIWEKVLGEEHPDTALSMSNLASLYQQQDAYAKAELLYLRVLTIREKVLGQEHPDTTISLSNLASLYLQQGAYAKAEPLYLRSLTIREKVLGPDHPDTATVLNNLAMLYHDLGAYAKAEPHYLRAQKIWEKVLGPDHPDTALSLNNLALHYHGQGAYAIGASLFRRGIRIETLFLQREVPLLPEAQRQGQIQALGNGWEGTFSYSGLSQTGTSLALFTRLNRHGLLQEIEQRQALLARLPGPQQELSQQIAGLTNRLADVNLSLPQRQALQQQLGDLEKQLYRQLPALQPRVVEPEEVARVLPADGVLVEFQRYRPFDGRQPTDKRWGEPRYLALLLFPDGRIASQDLGLASGIERLIRSALTISEKGEQSPNEAWVQVREKVLPPALLSQLNGRKRWFLSPDGELSRIPFAALPAPETLSSGPGPRWLAQLVRLRLITSGRDLLPKPRTTQVTAGQALVIANPEFGAPGTPWAPLRGTAREGQEIAAQLKANLLTGSQATAPALQRIKGPRVLHVASHGFFLDPQPLALPAAIAPQRPGSRSAAFSGPPASTGDPLLNSGIVLSGANRHRRPAQGASTQALAASSRDGDDDGYLTAKEASRLQLEGTELVVLSACDTATGVSMSGEGVYGLQRALTVAGARSTLLSLWKVDDEATAFFMQRYYSLLKAGKGRQEALTQVQEEFRTTPRHREWKDHKYWAAWQLTGDTAPLPGL